MTARQWYEDILIELRKVKAPVLLLDGYNYFINKAVQQYINKIYNDYEVNQQRLDDIRVLKSSAILTPTPSTGLLTFDLLNKTFEVNLPDDYWHMLGCVVEYNLLKSDGCHAINSKVSKRATKLSSDHSAISNNFYLKPSWTRPYWYINQVTKDLTYPVYDSPEKINPTGTIILTATIELTTPSASTLTITKEGVTYVFTYSANLEGPFLFFDATTLKARLEAIGVRSTLTGNILTLTSPYGDDVTFLSETGTYLVINTTSTTGNSFVDRLPGYRYGNRSKIRMEIRYGSDITTYYLNKVYIDYLRTPEFIQLTSDQIDAVEDTSQLIEFPDSVCQEITTELIKLLTENSSDPRSQSNYAVNQTIAGVRGEKR